MRPDRPAVLQAWGGRHGNFIQCTPALAAISEMTKHPVDVHFECAAVADMFRACPFINRIQHRPPKGRVIFTSTYWKDSPAWGVKALPPCPPQKMRPDYLRIYGRYAVQMYQHPGPVPMTYVDRVPLEEVHLGALADTPYVALVRGARSETWHPRKDPGEAVYLQAAQWAHERGFKVIAVGGEKDAEWFWRSTVSRQPGIIRMMAQDDIRQALALLGGATLVISNDTGLYHAAGALGRPTAILWKHTELTKNMSPSANCFYARPPEWGATIQSLLEAVTCKPAM